MRTQREDVNSAQRSVDRESLPRGRSVAVTGLSVVALLILGFRVVRTATDAGPLAGSEVVGMAFAAVAGLLAVAGAVMARSGERWGGGERWGALPIGGAVVLELSILQVLLAPPRLIAAIPLLFALAFVVVPARPDRAVELSNDSVVRKVLTGVALGLMVPVGLAYLTTGLVAPVPDLFGAYALFAVLLSATVWLARRRSWWVIAMPPLSIGLFALMLWLGGTFLDWSG